MLHLEQIQASLERRSQRKHVVLPRCRDGGVAGQVETSLDLVEVEKARDDAVTKETGGEIRAVDLRSHLTEQRGHTRNRVAVEVFPGTAVRIDTSSLSCAGP
jgi:hypothetical protein